MLWKFSQWLRRQLFGYVRCDLCLSRIYGNPYRTVRRKVICERCLKGGLWRMIDAAYAAVHANEPSEPWK